jgi:rubrerythrin
MLARPLSRFRRLHEYLSSDTLNVLLRKGVAMRSLRRGPPSLGVAPKSHEPQLEVLSPSRGDRCGATRAEFIARGILAGGALAGGSALLVAVPGVAISSPSPAQDQKILNFALELEYIEAGFYAEAFAKRKLTGDLLEYVSTVRQHERAHVAFLKGVLGSKARKEPDLDFGDATSDPEKFTAAAIALEETVIAAYNGQAANLTRGTLAKAATIVSVEARHAGWIRAIAGRDPAPDATDAPKTASEVQAAVNRTGFVRSS